MARTTAARIGVLLATFVVVLSTLTETANTMDLPYSDEAENLPYDVVDRPGASIGVWQRRIVDVLLEALTLLREEMATPIEGNAQQIAKRARTHYVFWRSPVFNGRPQVTEDGKSRKRSN